MNTNNDIEQQPPISEEIAAAGVVNHKRSFIQTACDCFVKGLTVALAIFMTFSLFLVRYFVNREVLLTDTAKREREWLSEFIASYGLFVLIVALNSELKAKAKVYLSAWLKFTVMVGSVFC